MENKINVFDVVVQAESNGGFGAVANGQCGEPRVERTQHAWQQRAARPCGGYAVIALPPD